MRGFNDTNRLHHLGRLLEVFPASKLSKRGPVLRLYAIEFTEPPVLERPFEPGGDTSEILTAARSCLQPDCCLEIDTAWDLWQYDGEWKLQPAAVKILCFGSAFEANDTGDHLRIEFGLDANFLPMPAVEGALRMQQSNLRSLLHLVAGIEKALPLERRQVWSESGANFADMLKQAVSRFGPN